MPIALISVSNKTGIIDFVQGLHKLGWSFFASGGTAQAIQGSGLPVKSVAEYTGSPEILAGRVKTLHPMIFGGILARKTDEDSADLSKINASYIDLVVCNLYPFEQTIKRSNATLGEAIENIDIGGVALIRAAAKNYSRVVILTDPIDYSIILKAYKTNSEVSAETRRALANKAFNHTAAYDSSIGNYLNKNG